MTADRITVALGTWIVALGLSLPAQALEPAIRCESAKVKEAGKYHFCRMKAESKAIKKGTDPSAGIAKCDAKYSIKWPKIETKGAGACPTNGDEASMQSRLTAQVDDVTTLLSGGILPLLRAFPAVARAFPATGQTTCWDSAGSIIPCAGTGQDGEIQAGAALSYTDNGDGTITDVNSGLMWEKLSDDGSIHDVDDEYDWDDAFGVKVAMLNGGSGFAGYTDWRLPNINELLSIIDLGAAFASSPLSPVFVTGCAPACTVLTCSCTAGDGQASNEYLSSTTAVESLVEAWAIVLDRLSDGGPFIGTAGKAFASMHVRAVRGP